MEKAWSKVRCGDTTGGGGGEGHPTSECQGMSGSGWRKMTAEDGSRTGSNVLCRLRWSEPSRSPQPLRLMVEKHELGLERGRGWGGDWGGLIL